LKASHAKEDVPNLVSGTFSITQPPQLQNSSVRLADAERTQTEAQGRDGRRSLEDLRFRGARLLTTAHALALVVPSFARSV